MRLRKPAILLLATVTALALGGGTADAACQFQVVPIKDPRDNTKTLGLALVSICVAEENSFSNRTQRGTSVEPVGVGVLVAGQGALIGVNGGAEQSTVTYKKSGKTIRVTALMFGGTAAPPGNNTIGTTGTSYKLGTTQTETRSGSRTDQVTTAGGDVFVGQALLPGGGVRLGFEVREDRKGATCTQRVVVRVLVAGGSQSVGHAVPCSAQAPRYPDFPSP